MRQATLRWYRRARPRRVKPASVRLLLTPFLTDSANDPSLRHAGECKRSVKGDSHQIQVEWEGWVEMKDDCPCSLAVPVWQNGFRGKLFCGRDDPLLVATRRAAVDATTTIEPVKNRSAARGVSCRPRHPVFYPNIPCCLNLVAVTFYFTD